VVAEKKVDVSVCQQLGHLLLLLLLCVTQSGGGGDQRQPADAESQQQCSF
jgi:hypothetical protein